MPCQGGRREESCMRGKRRADRIQLLSLSLLCSFPLLCVCLGVGEVVSALEQFISDSLVPWVQEQCCNPATWIWKFRQVSWTLSDFTALCFLGFLSFFWLCHVACGILVHSSGVEPVPLPVRVQNPNYRTAREFPFIVFIFKIYLFSIYSLFFGCNAACKF